MQLMLSLVSRIGGQYGARPWAIGRGGVPTPYFRRSLCRALHRSQRHAHGLAVAVRPTISDHTPRRHGRSQGRTRKRALTCTDQDDQDLT